MRDFGLSTYVYAHSGVLPSLLFRYSSLLEFAQSFRPSPDERDFHLCFTTGRMIDVKNWVDEFELSYRQVTKMPTGHYIVFTVVMIMNHEFQMTYINNMCNLRLVSKSF